MNTNELQQIQEETKSLGITYTFQGPAERIQTPEGETLRYLPKSCPEGWETKVLKMKAAHAEAFSIILSLTKQREDQGIRVPIFVSEMKQYVEKSTVKDLEKMGLIEIKLAQFNGGEAVNVLWLTGAGDIMAKESYEKAGF